MLPRFSLIVVIALTVASPVLASEFIEGGREITSDKNETKNELGASGNQIPKNSKFLSIPIVVEPSARTFDLAETGVSDRIPVVNEKGARESLANITSVSELSDVKPTDWAFAALKSLVERYGLIAGYPDGNFRGNRALTRYEFAAALNATLDRLNQQIATNTANFISREDLEILRRLQAEFEGELASLRGRVENLSQRLEAVQQFSTTTTLDGEALLGAIGVEGNEKADGKGDDVDSNLTFGYRVRLNFDTSFTGKDRLAKSDLPSRRRKRNRNQLWC